MPTKPIATKTAPATMMHLPAGRKFVAHDERAARSNCERERNCGGSFKLPVIVYTDDDKEHRCFEVTSEGPMKVISTIRGEIPGADGFHREVGRYARPWWIETSAPVVLRLVP